MTSKMYQYNDARFGSQKSNLATVQYGSVDGFYAIFSIYHIQRCEGSNPLGLGSQYLQSKHLERARTIVCLIPYVD